MKVERVTAKYYIGTVSYTPGMGGIESVSRTIIMRIEISDILYHQERQSYLEERINNKDNKLYEIDLPT